jgi:hypothetical protein
MPLEIPDDAGTAGTGPSSTIRSVKNAVSISDLLKLGYISSTATHNTFQSLNDEELRNT